MTAVCLSGARGRMGRMLLELVRAAEDLSLSAALERLGHPDQGMQLTRDVRLTDDARAAIQAADVLLDFSLPDAVIQHLELAAELKKPVVTGTTGFSKQQHKLVREKARLIPVVLASNMSRGVFLLGQLVGKAASALSEHDAKILEIHHKNKLDSPSGTALQLAEIIQSSGAKASQAGGRKVGRAPDEIDLAALRGGDVVGEHQVMFLGPGEQLILTHRAASREHFGRGALEAIRFVADKKPGLYGMSEVFGES